MQKLTTLTLTAFAALGLAAACSMEMGEPVEEGSIAETSQAAECSNAQAVNSVLAGMAVASAMEMKRWLPERDMVFTNGEIQLSQYAWPRCPNRNCKNTAMLLKLQSWDAHGMIFGGQSLDVGILRSRIATYWNRQDVCNNRPDNHSGDDCPVEYHDLKFSYKVKGSCDTDYWFHAYKMGTTSPLQYPYQLKNKLLWAGYPDNPYLSFVSVGDDVKIDPTPGTMEDDTTTSGSCVVACSKPSPDVNITGQCCTCNGVNKTFKPHAKLAGWYVCQ